MPIRADLKALYPPDWAEISRRIRFERAGGRCERCGRYHGELVEGWKLGLTTRVVLTTAHLGRPAELPFFFHVARHAEADEVINLIGFLMPPEAETFEWQNMMYRRASSQFLAGPKASGTHFTVSLPSGPTGLSPRGAVIAGFPAGPIRVRLTAWRDLGKPFETTTIGAKTSPSGNVVPASFEGAVTAFASEFGQSALRSADVFSATGVRTRSLVVGGLLDGHGKFDPTNDACVGDFGFPGFTSASGMLGPEPSDARRLGNTPVATGFPCSAGAVREGGLADDADKEGCGNSWSGHAVLNHHDNYPENCAPNNLMSLCQRCHLSFDREYHLTQRRLTLRLRLAIGDLFDPPPLNPTA